MDKVQEKIARWLYNRDHSYNTWSTASELLREYYRKTADRLLAIFEVPDKPPMLTDEEMAKLVEEIDCSGVKNPFWKLEEEERRVIAQAQRDIWSDWADAIKGGKSGLKPDSSL